jgi:hypothetical protein
MKSVRLAACGDTNAEALIAYSCAADAEGTQPGDASGTTAWDWDLDHLVLYKDGENPGWYIAFNTRFGTCFHLMFLG